MRLELTRRGDYAVRAAIALARNDGSGLMSTRRIAAAMAIPPRFLPQVMADLVRAGVVLAQTGRAGGYRLARPSSEISLLAVIRAAERDTRTRSCILRGGPCDPAGHCDVHEAFVGAREAMLDSLERTSIATIVMSREGPGPTGSLAFTEDGTPA
jgi:Rrf2 family protein